MMTTVDWFMLIFAGAYLVLLNWQRLGIASLKQSLDKEVKALNEALDKEKEQTVWRVDEMYKRIESHKNDHISATEKSNNLTFQNRKEVDNKMNTLMTEAQVKDFVDRSLKPIKDGVDKVEESNSKIHADVRVMNTMLAKLVKEAG